MSSPSNTHWERLGFRDDPYHVGPLPVGSISIDLFVGRTNDRDRLRGYLANYVTGKTMVQGSAGVGKTSLVNVVQQSLFADRDRFPLFEIVETTASITGESFLLWVLSAVVSSLRHVFGEDALAADPGYRAARDAVTQVLSIGFTGALSVPILPGASATVGQVPRQTSPVAVTIPTLLTLLRGLVSLAEGYGFRGLIVPVNNLDQLGNEMAVHSLNMIRDITGSVEGIHWVLIGGEDLFQTLEAKARRVSETFTSNPITVGPLSWDDVQIALERRRSAFAVVPTTPLPISMDVAKFVYDAAHGELRFMFARLSRTVLDFMIQFPSERVIPDSIALSMIQEWAHSQLARHRLTMREAQIIDYLSVHGTVRSKHHDALGFNRPQQLSNLLRDLQEKEYVMVVSEEGTSRVYGLTPAALLSRDLSRS